MIVVQRVFNSSGARLWRTILVKPGVGYVTIESSQDGINWIKTDTIATEGGYILFQGKALIRVTPFDGAEYDYI